MESPPIPPATPPAMAPVFDLLPSIGIGVAEFEEEPRELLLVEELELELRLEAGVKGRALVGVVEETPDGPSIVPGPNSGLPMRGRTGVR